HGTAGRRDRRPGRPGRNRPGRRGCGGRRTDRLRSGDVGDARLAAPKTVYAFPGQGIQHKGMGMEVGPGRRRPARCGRRGQIHRETLASPSCMWCATIRPASSRPVCTTTTRRRAYLTQFTQVAMATVAAAQVAEMREAGAFVEGAIACGHSVGEYTALACVTGIYELEALLEMVFHRGSKMHDIVPRDELGRSNYRLAAIRPSQIDLDDADVPAFVAEIAERTGEFLEIVNYNLRGSQYAIAGTVRGLEALEAEVERRREITGGKRSFILVPGIDVPFHSRYCASVSPNFAVRWTGSCRATRIPT
ncbi:acyl transferase domain protein, partial [Mycobacterium xenopi 4042]